MANIYVQAFKELIDEIIRENRNNPERAKQLIVNEVLREARKVFKPEEYREIQEHARTRLAEIGVGIGNIG